MRVLILLLTMLVCSQQALAWGKTGQRVIGQIAEHYLSTKARLAALQRFRATLLDAEAGREDKQRALRFIVHIVYPTPVCALNALFAVSATPAAAGEDAH